MVEIQLQLKKPVAVLAQPKIHMETDDDSMVLNCIAGDGTNTLIFRGFSNTLLTKTSTIKEIRIDSAEGQLLTMEGAMLFFKEADQSLVEGSNSNISLIALDKDNDVSRVQVKK